MKCGTTLMFAPDSRYVREVRPSPNVNARRGGLTPEILVLHYTGLPTFARSLEVLSDVRSQVSCHYVVDIDGRVVQMVPEHLRAWHAGLSSWQGETDINSKSIGIEIQNSGHGADYPNFPDIQMAAVENLAADIISRNGIEPRNVVAHSDIAPGRKIDPGEKFDWRRLAEAGVGVWVVPEPVSGDHGMGAGACDDVIVDVQQRLRAYGYGVEKSGVLDARTSTVVAAFQLHFRPAKIDGRIDWSTRITLARLTGGAV